mgnify:CR=1 FL=1
MTNCIKEKCDEYFVEGIPTLAKSMDLYPYFNPIESEQGPLVSMAGHEMIMLGSNNYLGMTGNPQVKQAAINAIEEFGVGTTGSRLLNGTFHLHQELESRLAKFLGKEDCIVFSTGMQANLGALGCLFSKGDEIVVSDELNHASIIDGLVLSRRDSSNKVIFKHNDMDDLRTKMNDVSNGKSMIVTEGIFSMEGDISPMDEIVNIAKENESMVYLDDAHSFGVLGPHGEGAAAHFGVTDDVDVLMGTFSKSFASCGGYVAASEEICNWIRHNGRAFIFSASIPPANCATVLAVLDIVEKDTSYKDNVLRLAGRMKNRLSTSGFDIGKSVTPIIPIIIGDEMMTFQFFKSLFEHQPKGVFTNPVRAPAVPEGHELLRTSYMASMTDELIDEAADIIEDVGHELEII